MAKKTEQLELVAEPLLPVMTSTITPMSLIEMALTNGADIDKLEKLMAMQEKWQAQQAKRSFLEAMSNFQAEVGEIKKGQKVIFGQGKASYKYANLGTIDSQIKKPLQKYGLTKRWEMKDEGNKIIMSCIISHKDGHSERTNMESGLDDSGGKNLIQSKGSAITYLQRYSLIAALGLTTADSDDDGKAAAKDGEIVMISEEEYSKVMKHVIAGTTTLAKVLANRGLSSEQEKALKIAEDARKKPTV